MRVLPSIAVATFTLSGCAAGYGPPSLAPGASVADAVAAMGTPTGRYPMSGGERVEYARGPYGKHTFMIDFDAQGRMTGWRQVLNEAEFNAIRTGMTREEVLQNLGHPSESRPLTWQRRTLWSYRYDAPFCKWFQVGLDERGQVVDTGYGPDPLCDALQVTSPP